MDEREIASIISQPHVIAISGVLSFFIKGNVSLAFLIAFIQDMWMPFLEIWSDGYHNSMPSFLHGLFQFFGRRFIRKSPHILVLLLPLATAFPPGSLNVLSHCQSNFDEIPYFPILNIGNNASSVMTNVFRIQGSLL